MEGGGGCGAVTGRGRAVVMVVGWEAGAAMFRGPRGFLGGPLAWGSRRRGAGRYWDEVWRLEEGPGVGLGGPLSGVDEGSGVDRGFLRAFEVGGAGAYIGYL